MSKKDKKDRKLEKIAANPLSRGVSLFNLSINSGARFAGLKVKDLFSPKDQRKERFQQFLSSQAIKIAEELGKLKGSVMKAGQMLSIYGEHFLPPEVNKVLKTLQSDSRPVVWSEMEKVLLRQLGSEKLAKLSINKEPIAAASMGQVYLARIKKSKQQVAIKIQYPGVDKAIDSDLKSLKSILSISNLVPMGPSFEEVFKEIRMMLHHEADYSRELDMFQFYREQLADDGRFIVPQVYPEFSSKRVLTMSYEEGAPVDGQEILDLDPKRRNRIAAAAMELMFKEIFEWRIVQTDPHFGNYKIRLNNDPQAQDKIILLDFGAVRKFPKKYIEPFAKLVKSALAQDPVKNIEAGRALGFLRDKDGEDVLNLFSKICFTAIEAFNEEFASPSLDGSDEGPNPYLWGQTDIINRLTELAKNAVFTFKLRTPPREAIFLDRKMIGMYTFLAQLKLRMGPRNLLQKYVEPY
ncbi:MAG: AarF/ABC1/UbiB kinase family protein [Oligoflexales bacterium]|nr:AarF/ABC1/UbiB kinase family protein [Oligoflexales bacterium]